MSFNVGEQVGDYQILQVLGAGGMGKVYKVRNVITDRVEALKVLLPDLTSDAELADRFAREIRMLASLSHPNIAGLHTAVRLNNQLLMVMEYVEGETVQKELSAGPLPTGKALEYADQTLTALAYAHAHNIIHRDIKPANLMVTASGVIKLMDFGIARPTEDSRLTQTGRTVGSLSYMSPEQINGHALDCRADLYSFGISLYEMVTGMLPFRGTSDFSIMAGHLQQQPVPPIQLDPKLPPMLSDIILMAIAKDRDQRFQTAEAMRGALRNITHSVTEVLSPGAAPKAQPMPPPPISAAPPPQHMPPPVVTQSSHRGLYLALGSLLTVGIIGLAAYEVPKLMHSSAATVVTEQKTDGPAEKPAATTPASTTPTTPAETPVVHQAEVTQAQTPESPAAQTPAATPLAQQQQQSAPPQTQPVRATPPRQAPTQIAQANPVTQAPVYTQAPVQQSQNPDTAKISSSPIPPSAQEARNAEQMEEIREQYIKLAAREKAAEGALARLERSIAATGGGLRGDMIEARQRMGFYLNDAEAALKAGNAAGAARAMEKADREVSKIESFLGR